MKNPTISIIVPVYNVEKCLERCIDSILSQSFCNFELLLVDDGSTDSSGIICDDYKKRDERIRVFHEKNRGVPTARNIGMNNAIGSHLMFIDSDDCLTQGALEKLYQEAVSSDADIVFANCNIISENGNIDYHKSILQKSLMNNKDFLNYLTQNISSINFITVWNKIYKKTLIGDKRFDEKLLSGQDYPFNLELYPLVKKVVLLPEAYYNYYENPNSLSRFFNAFKFSITLRNLKVIENFYYSNNQKQNINYFKLHNHKTLFSCFRRLVKFCDKNEYKKALKQNLPKIDFTTVFINGFHPKEIVVLLLIKFKLFSLLRLLRPLL